MADNNYTSKQDFISENGHPTNRGINYGVAGVALLGAGMLGASIYFGSQEIGDIGQELQAGISSNSEDIQKLDGNIRQLDGNIQVLDGKVGNLERRVSSDDNRRDSNNLFTQQDCSIAELRNITDTLHFSNSSGDSLGSISQPNYEDNTSGSFSDRVLGELESKFFDPTGIHDSVSLTFRVPEDNDRTVMYSPEKQDEVRDILEDGIKGDCTGGVYNAIINNRANTSSQVEYHTHSSNRPNVTINNWQSNTPAQDDSDGVNTNNNEGTKGCAPEGYSVGGVGLPGTQRDCN